MSTSDELLARLDAGPTAIESWTTECYANAAARIRALQSEIQAHETVRDLCLEALPDCQAWGDVPGFISTQAARIAELERLVDDCFRAINPQACPDPIWYTMLKKRVESLRADEREALGPVPPPRPRDKEVG